MQGVLLDTSFLITLADRNRSNHETAKRYWKFFLESQTPIYLSTIVISEFELKQPIDHSILRSCIILPFNHADAVKSAQLNFAKYKAEAANRDALKDDFKIVAQAEVQGAAFLVTDDVETLFKICSRLKAAGAVSFSAIKLVDGFHDSTGQKLLETVLDDADAVQNEDGNSATGD